MSDMFDKGNDTTQQFPVVSGDDGYQFVRKPDCNGDDGMKPLDTRTSQKRLWVAAAVGLFLLIFVPFTIAITRTTNASTNTGFSNNVPVVPTKTPSASPSMEPTQAPSSSKAPVTQEPAKTPVETVKPKENINPTPTANSCDIDLLKGTMTQDESEQYVAECSVAGKDAAQKLVNWFSNNRNVYASTPEASSDLEELQRELGPANYGHMRAGYDVFEYLYNNNADIQNALTTATLNNKGLAIDQQFLELWYKSSEWNAYPHDVKQPWFNALALRHYLALRAA